MPRRWLDKRKKDYYYRAAKKSGYRSRAAYKLMQMVKKFHVMRKGDIVLDLGAAPGGWSQAAKEIVGHAGRVFAVDKSHMREIDGVSVMTLDLDSEGAVEKLTEWIGGPASVVISDMSPRISGNWTMDHARSVHLSEIALRVAERVLEKGGNAVIKIFQGEMYDGYLRRVKGKFDFVKGHRPKAVISESAEIYVVAKGFKG